MAKAKDKKPTYAELADAAAKAADEKGMVAVRALIDGVTDNGHRYAKGDLFHMHKGLVAAHVLHGRDGIPQVEIVKGEKRSNG